MIALVAPAFRLLRGFRMFRPTRAARGLQLVRVMGTANRGMNALRKAMRRRGLEYVVALTALVNLLGAAGMYAFERAQETEGGFSSYGDALWWTSMLLATMGSGYWPVTAEGRILRLLLAGYPRHRDSLIALATIERDHGRLAEAERHAAAALALDPTDRDAAALVGQIRARRGPDRP